MGQNLDEGKKSAVYPYYHSPPHVNMIMISSTFQMVDLSIFVFQSHTLTFFNAVKGNAFVNRSARLLYDRIC